MLLASASWTAWPNKILRDDHRTGVGRSDTRECLVDCVVVCEEVGADLKIGLGNGEHTPKHVGRGVLVHDVLRDLKRHVVPLRKSQGINEKLVNENVDSLRLLRFLPGRNAVACERHRESAPLEAVAHRTY